MVLSEYAYKKGYNKNEYYNLENGIKKAVTAFIEDIPDNKKDNGIYYPVCDILQNIDNRDEIVLEHCIEKYL